MSTTARHALDTRANRRVAKNHTTALMILVVMWSAAGVCGLLFLSGTGREPSAQPVVARPAAQTLSAYPACELALAAEHARWQYSGIYSNPAQCDQPTVTPEQYFRAWRTVGGEMWNLIGDTSHTTHAQN